MRSGIICRASSLRTMMLVFALTSCLAACSDSSNPSAENNAADAATDAASSIQNPGTAPNSPEPNDVTSEESGENSDDIQTQARYRLTFEADWSVETHPLLFPFNPHFSPLTGATHNEQVVFWEPGQNATAGIERMAESGSTSLFREEVDFAVSSGYAQNFVNAGGIATSPGSVSIEFDVSLDYPMITLTSMLAPSPDWFVGVHGLMLHDGQEFMPQISVDLVLYDSGTDSGPRYTSSNDDTQPPAPIARVSSDAGDSPFVDGSPAVGRILLERL